MFTVGGPLSSEAVLKRGGLLVDLANFQVGDRVIVEWRVTEQDHLILVLKAKKTSFYKDFLTLHIQKENRKKVC